MSEHEKPDALDRLVEAYEHMLKRTHDAIGQAESEAVPAFRELLYKARDTMVELGELTREEADKVAAYVERDIKDAATYIAETGDDIKSWWRFDLDQIQHRMLESFAGLADRTSLELYSWAEQARQASRYVAGEVTGPGNFVCRSCDTEMEIRRTGRIPPCPQCGGLEFRRASGDGGG